MVPRVMPLQVFPKYEGYQRSLHCKYCRPYVVVVVSVVVFVVSVTISFVSLLPYPHDPRSSPCSAHLYRYSFEREGEGEGDSGAGVCHDLSRNPFRLSPPVPCSICRRCRRSGGRDIVVPLI